MRRFSLRSSLALGLVSFFTLNAASHAGEKVMVFANGKWQTAESKDSAPSLGFFSANLVSPKMLADKAKDFLSGIGKLNLVSSWSEKLDWKERNTLAGERLTTVRLDRTYRGIPVFGGESLVHFDGDRVASASLDQLDFSSITVNPTLSKEEAKAMAFASYRGSALTVSEPVLKILVLKGATVAKLAYEMKVKDRNKISSQNYFLDAHTGAELLVTTNVLTLLNRTVYVASGTEDDKNFTGKGWSQAYADNGCSGLAGDGKSAPCNLFVEKIDNSAKGAWLNSAETYGYYNQVHRRDSIDGKGMPIDSVVNFMVDFENAAWIQDLQVMIYGLGGGPNGLNDFASSLDVAAHEMTHGVTASTAALVYEAESGALNESYSDIFGKLVQFRYGGDPNDWTIGRDLFPGRQYAIRDLARPEVGTVSQFKYRDQPCNDDNDHCGVHDNSGIPSKVAFLLSRKIGLEKLGRLYYMTLTQLLRSTSNFADARAQTLSACGTLFGANGSECRAVAASFALVGIN